MLTLEINAMRPWLIPQTGGLAEVERRLRVVDELEAVVSAESDASQVSVLQRTARLCQSILQKAFAGVLALP